MDLVDNPTNCNQLESNSAQNFRNFYCCEYDNCLDKAIENNWRSFSCQDCWKFSYKESMKKLYLLSSFLLLIKNRYGLIV